MTYGRYRVDPYGYEDQFECMAKSRGSARFACYQAMRDAGLWSGRDGFWRYLAGGVRVTKMACWE